MKILISICGASGSIYGIRVIEELSKTNIETHLIISEGCNPVSWSES